MPHPYDYSGEKNLIRRLVDIGVPAGLFLLYFQFYNFGQFNPREMIKTTGLLSISLLAITLLVGPLGKVFPILNVLKNHRKFWGITAFLAGLIHGGLVVVYYYKFNFLRFVDFSNPRYPGVLSGLLALIILFLVTITSNKKALSILSSKTWKTIQVTSYLALILAIGHFYLMEQVGGILVIKRLLGQITFWFAVVVVIIRLLVLFWPAKKT